MSLCGPCNKREVFARDVNCTLCGGSHQFIVLETRLAFSTRFCVAVVIVSSGLLVLGEEWQRGRVPLERRALLLVVGVDRRQRVLAHLDVGGQAALPVLPTRHEQQYILHYCVCLPL